jgi:hypothetical protein
VSNHYWITPTEHRRLLKEFVEEIHDTAINFPDASEQTQASVLLSIAGFRVYTPTGEGGEA